ncbi:MAG: GNAT family N-acetyltransferase [Chloroflexota bacterium]
MKHIETTRLLLRSMVADDVDHVMRLFNDPKVAQAFGLDDFDFNQAKRWLERNLMHQEEHGFGLYSVILKEAGDWIGDCGLECSEFNGHEAVEIGYDLLSAHWGCGYATEAALAVRDAATNDLDISGNRLCCFIRHGNRPSVRVAEKLGMVLNQQFKKRGVFYSLFAYPDAPFTD